MANQQSLPPQLDAIAKLVNAQPEDMRELFHYALAMLMVENGKAEITERHHVDNLEYLTIRTTAGDVFEILKPQVSEDLLRKMRALVHEILEQDRETDEE